MAKKTLSWKDIGLKEDPFLNSDKPLEDPDELKLFVDRRNELDMLELFQKSSKPWNILIYGHIGVGKSTLIRKNIADLNRRDCVIIDVTRIPTETKPWIWIALKCCEKLKGGADREFSTFIDWVRIEILTAGVRVLKGKEKKKKILAKIKAALRLLLVRVGGEVGGVTEKSIKKEIETVFETSAGIREAAFISLLKLTMILNKRPFLIVLEEIDRIPGGEEKIQDLKWLISSPYNQVIYVTRVSYGIRFLTRAEPLHGISFSDAIRVEEFTEVNELKAIIDKRLMHVSYKGFKSPFAPESLTLAYDLAKGNIRALLRYVGVALRACLIQGEKKIGKNQFLKSISKKGYVVEEFKEYLHKDLLFSLKESGKNIIELSKEVNASRHTVSNKLEQLENAGYIYGNIIGRAKEYKITPMGLAAILVLEAA